MTRTEIEKLAYDRMRASGSHATENSAVHLKFMIDILLEIVNAQPNVNKQLPLFKD